MGKDDKIYKLIRKKSTYVLVFLITLLFIPHYGHQPLTIKITTDIDPKLTQHTLLRVFNNPSGSVYRDYYILSKNYDLKVLNQKVFGFCFLKDINAQISIENKVIPLLKEKVPCYKQSNIKSYNQRLISLETICAWLFTSFVLTILLHLLIIFLTDIKSRNKHDLIQKFLFIIILSLWSVISYPLFFNIDLTEALYSAKIYRFSDWFSYVYEIFVSSMTQMGLSLRSFSYAGSTLAFICFCYYQKVLKRVSRHYYWGYFVVLIAALPFVGLNINFFSRDLIACLMSFSLALFIIHKGFTSNKSKLNTIDYIMLTVAIYISELRREMILTTIAFILLYICISNFNRKNLVKIIIYCLFLKFSGYLVENSLVKGNQKTKNIKVLVSLSHIIGSIITDQNYKSNDKSKDYEIINHYYKYDIIMKYHKDNDVEPTYKGAIRYKNSKDIDKIYSLTYKMILQNFKIFITSRLKMFLYTLGYEKKNIIMSDDFNYHLKRNEMNRETYNIHSIHKYSKNYKPLIWKNHFLWKKPFWSFNTFFSLGIILLCLLSFKLFKYSALASLVICARLPALFLLSPASQMKYIFDVYLFGIAIIPVMILEYKWYKKRSTL